MSMIMVIDICATGPGAACMSEEKPKRRPRIAQEDVPVFPLEQAVRIPKAIADNYAYKPTRPMNVAGAMNMSPMSGTFRSLTGAAVAYGLTTGAAQAPEIGITPLGLRVVRPTVEGDDTAALREALLRPKIVGEFLRNYDNAAIPSDAIAKNVLQEMGVPAERIDDVLKLILDSAKSVGFIKEWNGRRYVDLADPVSESVETSVPDVGGAASDEEDVNPMIVRDSSANASTPAISVSPGVHINIQIHIAADASSETVEDIFRNMRRYVLTADGAPDEDSSTQ